jgi:low temperature requirement protein LtrA
VAASGVSVHVRPSVEMLGGIALIVTCLLWWTYFGRVKDMLEGSLVELEGDDRARLARDVHTLWHFPLVSGIIALAVGFEASLHPDHFTTVQAAGAIGIGLTLFLLSTAAARWRARRCVLWSRLVVVPLTLAGLVWAAQSSVGHVLAVAAAGLVAVILIEQTTAPRLPISAKHA